MRELIALAALLGVGYGIIYVGSYLVHGTTKACPRCSKAMYTHQIKDGQNAFCPACGYQDMPIQVHR